MNELQNVPLKSGKMQQFLAALIVNSLSFSSGIGCGWPSPVIPQLRSNNTPVGDKPMTEDEISWISSLLPIGSLIIISFCGILVENLGRKKFALLTSLPHIISWSLIIFGQNHISLYAARLFIGVSCAMTIFITPMYISEIASEDIRGILGSMMTFSANGGILFAYAAGAFLSYRLFACVSVVFALFFVTFFGFMPETPAYLVRRHRLIQAHESLMFFRGNNQALVDEELNRIQSQVNLTDPTVKPLGLSDFISDQATRKGLIICFVLLGGQQLSGILAMLTYAETIFRRANIPISPETAPIIIAVIQMFGSYASTMLMDRAGRRFLTLISCLGMAFSNLLLGVFFNLQRNEIDSTSISWLPLVAFSGFILAYCLGMAPVPFLFTSEVFRLEVTSSATTLCYIFYWTMSSTAVKAFGPGMNLIGLHWCFYVLASLCAVCFVLSYYLMPETKGRKREDIIDELAGVVRIYQVDDDCIKV